MLDRYGDFPSVIKWYKKVGDTIVADEVLVDLETDKVILEVPVVKGGLVKEILFSVGDTVTAGQLLAVIDDTVQPEPSVAGQAEAKKPPSSSGICTGAV